MKVESTHRAGCVALVGRSNVGKSTLLNRIIGEKLSIISRKPQTTRRCLLGIKENDHAQVAYVDTPGIQINPRELLDRNMNKNAMRSMASVDLTLFMVEAGRWRLEDTRLLQRIVLGADSLFLVINKIDRLPSAQLLLPFIREAATRAEFREIVPVSAKLGTQVSSLEMLVEKAMPISPPYFSKEHTTDQAKRFFIAECIREKLIGHLRDEIPYQVAVTVEEIIENGNLLRVIAIIWVAHRSQKAIVIGKGGALLKQVGEAARHDLERFYKQKVFLQSWVKVFKEWQNDQAAVKNFGYGA